jgi:hypothetical protein
LNGWEILTGVNGEARFYNQLSQKQYGYTVESIGYQTLSDSMYLDIDTTVMVMLQITTGSQASEFPVYTVFPNPARESLYFRTGEGHALILLFNPAGKVLIERKLYGRVNRIDVSEIPPGTYTLCIKGKDKVIHQKIMIIR